MGQAMNTLLSKGGEEEGIKRNEKEYEDIIRLYYTSLKNKEDLKLTEFYHAVCGAIQEINQKLGRPQLLLLPKFEDIHSVFNKYHDKDSNLSRDQFKNIVQELLSVRSIDKETFSVLIYMFGIPIATLFAKKQLIPRSISDSILIPCVTSASVFFLSKFNKI